MPLTSDLGLAYLKLRIETIKLLLEPVLARLAGIDRASHLAHATSPKYLGPDQRVPVIFVAISLSEPKVAPS